MAMNNLIINNEFHKIKAVRTITVNIKSLKNIISETQNYHFNNNANKFYSFVKLSD